LDSWRKTRPNRHVTNNNEEKVTVSKYTKYRKTQLERLSLTASSYSNAKNRRYEYEAEEDKNLENLLFIWPKMVEYAGLS
jgi:hypothetical protein